MTGPIWLVLVLLTVAAAAGAVCWRTVKGGTDSDADFAVAAAALLVGGACALFSLLFLGGYLNDRNTCASYQQQTGRDTRFVVYTWVSWECLTPAADGKWIPTSQLRDLPGQP